MLPLSSEPVELKVVLVGNAGVGKTSLISRLIHNNFEEHNQTTVGAMFLTYTMTLNNIEYRLQIWDTAGQERLRSIAPLYYRDSPAIMLVFDLTDESSFAGLGYWLDEVRDKGLPGAAIVVAGNKLDLVSDKGGISQEEAEFWANNQGVKVGFVSAKEGLNVEGIFKELVQQAVEGQGRDGRQRGATVMEKQEPLKDKGCC